MAIPGQGIDQSDLERIFLAFQQVETADNRKMGGTGLGLAICRKLAEAHGGEISVESTLGAGTTFKVFLPSTALGNYVDNLNTATSERGLIKAS